MSEFPAYKGMAFNSTQRALAKLVPPQTHQKFLAAVSDGTRKLISTPPPATDWLPLEHLDDTYRTALKVCFNDELAGMFTLGHSKFTSDLSSVYKVFIKAFDPSAVLNRAPTVFAQYMRNNGVARAGKIEAKRCFLAWEGIRIGSRAFWEVQRGMAHGAAEATRMKNVQTKFTIGGNTESASELEISWT